MKLESGKHYVLELVQNALELEGSLIDIGIAGGEQTIYLAEEILKSGKDKKLYACDTWKGNPYTDEGTPVKSDLKVGEFLGYKIEDFEEKCKERKVDKIIIPVVGQIDETLQEELNNEKFCYAFLDANLYQSTHIAYKFLESRIVQNGIIGFHDYGFSRCPGVTYVIKNEIDKNMYKTIHQEGTHIFFQRQK